MRVVVRQDLCESNAVCLAQAPGVFDLDAQGIAFTIVDRVEGEQLEEAENAVNGCPREAIFLVDD